MERRGLCWVQKLLYLNNTKKVKISIAYLFVYSVFVCMCMCKSGINLYASHLVVFLLDKLHLFILTKHRFIIIQIIAFICLLHFSAPN
jgi:hypothetical protein